MRFVNVACAVLLIALSQTVITPAVFAAAAGYNPLPAQARVWQNRSGIEGAGYSDIQGPDVAYVNGGWYYKQDNGNWQLFHDGQILNLAEADSYYTEALKYELFAGTAFAQEGTPDTYDMSVDGATGELVTATGVSFSPDDFENLRAADGRSYYYHVARRSWSRLDQLGKPLSSAPPAPYKPLALNAGTVPSPSMFAANPVDQLIFEPGSRRYRHASGSAIAAFHKSIADSYRRWNNRSGAEGSGYSDMQGPDIVFVNNVWYQVQDETHFLPFFQGRYLNFSEADASIVEGLQYEVTVGAGIETDGLPADLNMKLDGVTGQLLTASGEPVTPVVPPITVLVKDTLMMQGVQDSNSAPRSPHATTQYDVKLLRVVPLTNPANNPFNDRSLPVAIRTAQNPTALVIAPPPVAPVIDTPVVTPPPPPPPPSGSCPLDTPLTVIATLPSEFPLGQRIYLTAATPPQLDAGNMGTLIVFNIAVIMGSQSQATVSLDPAYTYLSGSPLGVVNENTHVTYLLRRNSDSSEYEISFNFTVDIVFDDVGIIINTLSGRLCQAGVPL